MRFRTAVTVGICGLGVLSGCASDPRDEVSARRFIDALLPTPVLLLGEQHDAPEHQRFQRQAVLALAGQAQLAAVVLEMADAGRQTTGMEPNATEEQVQATLQWSSQGTGGWPWPVYAPVVMAAVRAGVPVLGGNLPRARMHAVMADETLDASLPPDGLREQRDNIRQGHCDLLPASQIAPMTRIQLARDRSMAQVIEHALQPGRTVLLIAGNQHVRRDLGVPQHLPPGQAYKVVVAQSEGQDAGAQAVSDQVWLTPARPPRDHCEALRRRVPG